MQPDLLERARSAVTVEEEAEAIMRAVHAMVPETKTDDYRHQLMNTARLVWAGFLPRPVLLGVVAALKPAHLRLICGENVQSSTEGRAWAEVMVPELFQPPISEGVAETMALAALIAILEASNAE